MKEIDIKAFFSQHRKACVMLAVFVLALLFGFSGGQKEIQDKDRVCFRELYREMRRILRILEPVLKPSAISDYRKTADPVVQGLAGLIARGVVSPLPDGSWNEGAFVTRGEALFYFGQLLQVFELDLVQPPMILEIAPDFVDIFSGHWLYESLPKLAGTGALAPFKTGRLNPDAVLHADELRGIGSALIDYLGSNLLILKYDGAVARLFSKGALHLLNVSEWSYSFNRRDWYQIGKDGELLPEFNSGRMVSLFFRHPSYRDAGPVLVKENVASIGMIKLQRNYADFAGNRILARKNIDVADSEEERERIRTRLAQIRDGFQHKKPSAGLAKAEIARRAADNAADSNGNLLFKEEVKSSDEMLCENSGAVESATMVQEKALDNADVVSFEGRVIDALNSEALKGAVVMIASRQYTADAQGKFSFTARPNSVLDLTAYSEGYEVLKIRHRAGYRAGPLTLTLKPVFASCVGRVTSFADESPVARALVKIGNRATRTSADGRFSLKGVRPGFHQISVFARGFMEAHEISHINTDHDQKINMRLRPMYSDNAVFADSYQDS